jgi:hypothetical protein
MRRVLEGHASFVCVWQPLFHVHTCKLPRAICHVQSATCNLSPVFFSTSTIISPLPPGTWHLASGVWCLPPATCVCLGPCTCNPRLPIYHAALVTCSVHACVTCDLRLASTNTRAARVIVGGTAMRLRLSLAGRSW